MSKKLEPAPQGTEVVKVGRDWVILLTPRNARGQLTGLGFIGEPSEGAGPRTPRTFRRRAIAVTYAIFHVLEQENAQLRAKLMGGGDRIEDSESRLVGVS